MQLAPVKLLVPFLILAWTPAPAAEACLPLRVPSGSPISTIMITKPGRYCLKENVYGRLHLPDRRGEGRIIDIRTSDVILDLEGHTVGRYRWPGETHGLGIEIDDFARNIEIRNGVLEGHNECVVRLARAPLADLVPVARTRTARGFRFDDPRDRIIIEDVTFRHCKRDLFIVDLPRE